jgi:hypothetical protein
MMRIAARFSHLLVACAVVANAGCGKDAPAVQEAEKQPAPSDAAAVRKKLEPHFEAAHSASKKALFDANARLHDFLWERRDRSRAFATEALSLRSKWELAKSKLPGTDSDGHLRFLRRRFEEVVFSQKELADVIQSAVEEYVEKLRGIENELLVALQADLGEQELAALGCDLRFNTDGDFMKEYARSLQVVADATARDLGATVGREVVTWVAADLVTKVGVSLVTNLAGRLGVSAGILSAGAASTVATLGIGLVAGVVIDALLDWLLLELGYDPVGDVQDEVDLALSEFEQVLLYGVVEKPEPLVFMMSFGTGRVAHRYKRAIERWQQWERQHAGAKDQFSGFQWELLKFYSDRLRLRNKALENLFRKGA